MSQWTHVLGVVRFDSMSCISWPEPHNKDSICKREVDWAHKAFSIKIPSGSEGPLDIETILTNRGPTVVITGDLRDFGKESIEEILTWLNKSLERHKNYYGGDEKAEGRPEETFPPFLRDAIVDCRVEYDDNLYLIRDILDGGDVGLKLKWVRADKITLLEDKEGGQNERT